MISLSSVTDSGRRWGLSRVEDILLQDDEQITAFLGRQKDLHPHEVRRFELLIRMYKLLHKKYNLGFLQLHSEITRAVNDGFPEMERLARRP